MTLDAVFTNLRGGKQPPEANAPLLRVLGAYLLSVEDKAEALDAFEASVRFQDNSELIAVPQRLRMEQSREHRKPSATRLFPILQWSIAIAVGGTLLLLLLGALPSIIDNTKQSSSSAYTSGSSPYVLTTTVIAPAFVPVSIPPNDSAPLYVEPFATNTPVPWFDPIMAHVTPIPEQRLNVCVSVANIRAGPSTQYPVVWQLTNEWKITVFGRDGEWISSRSARGRLSGRA